MLDNLKKYNIILASKSPRRKELLKGLDIPFTVETMDTIEEKYPNNLVGEKIPLYLAELKAEAYTNNLSDNTLLITADTIVWLEGKELGKPTDLIHAKKMLQQLSGKEHEVITGVCLLSKQKKVLFSATSKVRFASLTENEIDYYLEHYSPLDKAGSYGVQEWIGYMAVEHIEGSYFNVMGLPIQRLYKELTHF
ncbi:MAG: septum formation protein Maf [Paludibacteraceae bacterium]|nr:septum formation protein Maf [Paludibacteraceae bacterium]MBN2786921.1 septum formation protein Maf [Paludibacteraceae bacterium]